MHRYKGREVRQIERTGYVSIDVEPGDEIRWNDWDGAASMRRMSPDFQPFTLIPYSSGSDYSGNLVERSNYNYIVENYGDEVVRINGYHGTFGVGFLGSVSNLSEDLQDVIAGLHEYPLIDESGHSELELETENAAWVDHGADDFRKELAEHLESARVVPPIAGSPTSWSEILDDIDDTKMKMLWHAGCDAHNVNGGLGFINEEGDSIHFYISEWFDYNDYTEQRWLPTYMAWANEVFKTNYQIPTTEGWFGSKRLTGDSAVLADAIFEWFVPFAEVKIVV